MLTNELIKYDPHIVALQEIRWIGKGGYEKGSCKSEIGIYIIVAMKRNTYLG
jgi:hypothetical protein